MFSHRTRAAPVSANTPPNWTALPDADPRHWFEQLKIVNGDFMISVILTLLPNLHTIRIDPYVEELDFSLALIEYLTP